MNVLNKDNYSIKLNYPLDIEYDNSAFVPMQPLPKRISYMSMRSYTTTHARDEEGYQPFCGGVEEES